MSWRVLEANLDSIATKVDIIAERAVVARETVRASISEMKAAARSATVEGLESGYAATVWELWRQIAAGDANSPALIPLEQQLRRLNTGDLSFLQPLKAALRKAQQKKYGATRGSARNRFSGALDEGEFDALMNQYAGRG